MLQLSALNLKNAVELVTALVSEVDSLPAPSKKDFLRAALETSHGWIPTEEDETEMLGKIERSESDPFARRELEQKVSTEMSEYQITDQDRKRIERDIAPILQRVISDKYFVGVNLAALIVNARDTKEPALKRRPCGKFFAATVGLVAPSRTYF